MIVRTIVPEIYQKPSAIQKSQSLPKKTTPPLPKSQKQKSSRIDSKVLEELTKTLSALDSHEKPKQTAASLTVPKSITCKTDIETPSPQNGSYAEHLISLLTCQLELPELGSVKVCLTINASGSFADCKILEQKSHKNSEFLKNELRNLTFPCFNEFGLSDSQLEFIITFCNL